jgi:hypothetical protein
MAAGVVASDAVRLLENSWGLQKRAPKNLCR